MKILTIIDMQNDFLNKEVLGNDECVAIIPNIIEKIKLNQYDILMATRDTHPNYYLETQEGKNLPIIHCIDNTKGWEIEENIQKLLNLHNATIINKPTFGSIDLIDKIKEIIKKNNISENELELELCGVCTGICVISNVMLLKAAFPEAKIIVDSNCCACVTPETHKTALEAMKLCQISIL